MKHIAIILLLSLLVGCMSYSWKTDDEKYDVYTGKECTATQPLFLNKMEGKPLYAFYPHEISTHTAFDSEGIVVAKIPKGCKFFITESGRERGGDGHVWDYLIGEIKVQNINEPIRFEYLVGLTGHQRYEIPFKPVTR